jgi:hypothetical protein
MRPIGFRRIIRFNPAAATTPAASASVELRPAARPAAIAPAMASEPPHERVDAASSGTVEVIWGMLAKMLLKQS